MDLHSAASTSLQSPKYSILKRSTVNETATVFRNLQSLPIPLTFQERTVQDGHLCPGFSRPSDNDHQLFDQVRKSQSSRHSSHRPASIPGCWYRFGRNVEEKWFTVVTD
ncbi:hypothetical protein FVEG_06032 [Fusarium verticillioides 7600]|uniref:Uncharacterized protein n=1 Tax=Gibberella moniliformis (strain M3125 / FGSC 7600) TaxID=334819 RepID=W7MBX6_GIBM7|nr:hypothetical protein FVEG_06032 [Fusarium verticillioides 7600]EWG45110.1 hypothetical protein FVEG_06032 [Fusarium verticillioides 7600]